MPRQELKSRPPRCSDWKLIAFTILSIFGLANRCILVSADSMHPMTHTKQRLIVENSIDIAILHTVAVGYNEFRG